MNKKLTNTFEQEVQTTGEEGCPAENSPRESGSGSFCQVCLCLFVCLVFLVFGFVCEEPIRLLFVLPHLWVSFSYTFHIYTYPFILIHDPEQKSVTVSAWSQRGGDPGFGILSPSYKDAQADSNTRVFAPLAKTQVDQTLGWLIKNHDIQRTKYL